MKFFTLSMAAISTSLIMTNTSNAIEPTNTALYQSEFIYKIEKTQKSPTTYLTVSEKSGISLFNENEKTLANLPRKSEHLDVRKIPNSLDSYALASIDKNSGEILLIEADLSQDKLALRSTIPSTSTAFDALCLQAKREGIELFTIDVLGEVVHWSIYRSDNQAWQLAEINRFPVGPNIKACAVSEITESLYITEENIGVWRYPTNPEKELIRELIQLPKGLEVEYVDTTSSGDVAIVSPSINRLFLYQQDTKELTHLPLDKGIAPKTVQLTRTENTLTAFIFDDESAGSIVKKIQQPLAKLSIEVHTVESLPAYAQTDAVASYGDAADDPEIWVNSSNPEASLVYGTDKKKGLNVYNLQGKLVKALDIGRVNNVDIRYQVMLGGKYIDLAAASNRTTKSISLFAIDKATGLPQHLTDINTDLDDPYGLCMSQNNEQISVWINDTDGRFQQYALTFKDNSINGHKVLEWTVPSQPEGCVSDDATQRLFYGEESTGVWLKAIGKNTPDKLVAGLNPEIEADIEGMSLYRLHDKNFLVVSSQGNNRYAVYAVDDNHRYLGAFNVGANGQKQIDGASETDGLAVTSVSLGHQLPDGLLVVQDGHNVMPKAKQNFKLVDGALLRAWIENKIEQQ